MSTILSRNLPDELSVFRRILEKVNEKNRFSNSHIRKLLKRARAAPGSMSVGQYKEIERVVHSIHLKLLSQGSNEIQSKRSGLMDALRIVLKKMPAPDIFALKEEKCEEGKRRTEDCKNRLQEVVTDKQLAINKLQPDLVKRVQDLRHSLKQLPHDKEALAVGCIKNKDYEAFRHRPKIEMYFPARYKLVERETQWGSKVYKNERIRSVDEEKWIVVGYKLQEWLEVSKQIESLNNEIARLPSVEVDRFHFPKITAEQAKFFPESDYPREDIKLDYSLKALVAERLNDIIK